MGWAEKASALVDRLQTDDQVRTLSTRDTPAWIADPKQPDYGNFCFGHFNVTAIENAMPDDPSNPTQYTVKYARKYEVEGIPDWVRTPESDENSFPRSLRDVHPVGYTPPW